jgi:predicted MFS family arabinose efflux permease
MSVRHLEAPAEKRLVYCVALAACFFQFESFMIVVALPDMAREMHASAHAVSYVISGLLFGLVATLVCASWLGQQLGFSRLFLTGTYLAMLATIACGASPSLSVLIASRIVQGIGIGAIVASSYALLPRWVNAKRLGWAFGLLSTGAGAGMILGLPVGGFISSYFEWRWLFCGTVPFLLALALLAHKSIPSDQPAARQLNLRMKLSDIYKLPNVFAGLLMLFIFQGVMGGLRFLTPFILENQAGATPTVSGFIFLSYPLGFLLLSAWSGRQADTFSPKRLMLFASCLSLSACLLYLLFIDSWGVWHFSVFLLFLGAATGLFSPPNNLAILRGLSEADIQVVSTLIPISLNASLMFGTFSFGLLFKEHDPSLVLMISIAAFAGIIFLTKGEQILPVQVKDKVI